MTDAPAEQGTSEPWRMTAAEQARAIADGRLSCEDAVQSAIDRMEAVNPELNAVVQPLGDAAIARARDFDKYALDPGRRGPLHGVPVTIKVNVDQAGCATTNGIPAFRDAIAPEDAPVVSNLLAAGAIVVGRTNTPEFSFRADTDNPLHGRTANPWGAHVSPGGSSGGAGAAVMAGIGALAHGNDIGGSLRFPASANGGVTVKPGLGRVAAYNPSQKAERGMLAQAMSVQGLIARSAGDLALAMPSLIAPDSRDPFHVPLPWDGPPTDEPVRVGFTAETHGPALHPDVAAALNAARGALEEAGYDVEEIEVPDLRECAELGYRALMGEVKALMGADIEEYGSPAIKSVFESYFRLFPPLEGPELLRAMAARSKYARWWSLQHDRTPLVLTPFLSAPYFGPDADLRGDNGVEETLGSAYWSFAMNFLGLPAGCVPARVARLVTGPQPIGVQIVGKRWREDLVVRACMAVEAGVGRVDGILWDLMES